LITGVIAVLSIAVLSEIYLVSNSEPSRPPNVTSDAVFLWAPYVGFPSPRRGWWISCREEKNRISCTESEIDGLVKFAGQYQIYRQNTDNATTNSLIDAKKSRDFGVFINHKYVHLIYLKNGAVLIPKMMYEEGKAEIDKAQSTK
jgi:hypothetical protein